jgi:hypothetical protein
MPDDLRDFENSRTDIEEAEKNRDFIRRYTGAKQAIVEDIKEKLKEYAQQGLSEPKYYPVIGFEKEIQLLVLRSTSDSTAETSLASNSRPFLYINTEERKVCEAICQKLGQMLPGMMNILLIRSTGTTFNKRNLSDAVALMDEMVKKRDDDFFVKNGLTGVQDYRDKLRNLSGILFKSGYKITRDGWTDEPSLFWCNDMAEVAIPEDVQHFFETVVSSHPRCYALSLERKLTSISSDMTIVVNMAWPNQSDLISTNPSGRARHSQGRRISESPSGQVSRELGGPIGGGPRCSYLCRQVHKLLRVIHNLHKRAAAFQVEHFHDVSQVGVLDHRFGCPVEFRHPWRAMKLDAPPLR